MVRAPFSVPPSPEFYKELAWVPEAQRKHTGRDASLCPYFCSSLGLSVPACPCQPLPALFQPRRRLMALSSPMATVTSAWVAPRRRGVPRTLSPVPTVGDQVMPPPEVSGGRGGEDSRSPDLEERRQRSERTGGGGCRASQGH